MSERKLLVFDFDGTLADTQPALDLALKEFSDARGLPHDPLKMAIGYVDPTRFDLGWGLSLHEQIEPARAFQDFIKNVCTVEERFIASLFDGVTEFLDEIKVDYDITIVTARDKPSFLSLVQHHKIDTLFSTYRTSCCARERGYKIKPQPDALNCVLQEMQYQPEHAIVIGDTTSDIRMAKNAGVKSIGVLWGAHDRDTLQAENADAIAENVVDLRGIIAKLGQS